MPALAFLVAAGLPALASRPARADDEAPPATSPPPAPVEAPAPGIPRYQPRPEVFLSGGASYRSIFSLPVDAWTVGGGVGLHVRDHAAVYALASFEQGQTAAGLATHFIDLGAGVDGVFGRVRPGIGLRVGDFGFRRISTGGWIDQVGVGATASLGVDVLKLDGHALFVGGCLEADVFPTDASVIPMLGAQGYAGARW